MAPMMKAAKDSRAQTERITVRLPDDMVAAIDAECSRRIGNVSRNTWILEAVQEKLSRAGSGADKQSNDARGN
ncbi:CopG family [Ralstonia solanacearum]|nr:CopG family [Ralstonia solanacearum]